MEVSKTPKEIDINEIISYELAIFEEKDKIPDMTLISDSLYLGNYASALDIVYLKANNIKSILVAGANMIELYRDDFEYLSFNLYESEYTKIDKYFEKSSYFIEKGLEKGGVLVHCGHGVSRSPSLICAFLIKSCNIPFSEAIAIIKGKRNIVKPNQGFEKQLRNYSFELTGKF